jgi:predicted RNase H-like nuclease (RuvC/YqgF family)
MKHSAKKKSVNKRSLKKTEYKMKGMGMLLNMYSSTISHLEKDLMKLKIALKHIILKYKNEKNEKKRIEMKEVIKNLKKDININKENVYKILSNISNVTTTALKK